MVSMKTRKGTLLVIPDKRKACMASVHVHSRSKGLKEKKFFYF